MKITNGKDIFDVTRGAFENNYRRLGFVPFVESVNTDALDDALHDMTNDEAFIADIREKPIAQWSNDELRRYAKLVGVNPKSKNLREIIKQMIEGEDETNDETDDGH